MNFNKKGKATSILHMHEMKLGIYKLGYRVMTLEGAFATTITQIYRSLHQ